MGTLPNPRLRQCSASPREPDHCERSRWCDEPHRHSGPCRRYLGEARAGTGRNPSYVAVAVIGAGRRDRRLELSAGAEYWVFDWSQVEHLITLLVLARKSYAT
jgi:hypothetical protein